MSVLDTQLILNAKNRVVSEFKTLVYDRVNDTTSSVSSRLATTVDTIQAFETNARSTVESTFDKTLYDLSLKLSETKSVALKSTESVKDLFYAKFNGGQTYIDWAGNLLTNAANSLPTDGWVTLNKASSTYAMLTSAGKDYIVKLSDIVPNNIVSDFQPLYDALNNLRYALNDYITDDIHTAYSVATTIRDNVSLNILNGSDQKSAVESDQLSVISNKDMVLKQIYDSHRLYASDRYKYPSQLQSDRDRSSKYNGQYSVYNNIQAIIYDLPSGEGLDLSIDKSHSQLFCFQQPDSVSYTSSAQFDSVSPRGSQQPFQFYNNNNAISMSFTLRWHIDEIRTLIKEKDVSYTIQDIANIAESFTRPWDASKSKNSVESLKPKLCHVILPGVSQIGYITEAQINLSGDMSGDYATGSGIVSSASESTLNSNTITNYFYSQIEITFSMLVVKDIHLEPLNTSTGIAMSLLDTDGSFKPFPTKAAAKQEETDENGNGISDQQEQDGVEAQIANGMLMSLANGLHNFMSLVNDQLIELNTSSSSDTQSTQLFTPREQTFTPING